MANVANTNAATRIISAVSTVLTHMNVLLSIEQDLPDIEAAVTACEKVVSDIEAIVHPPASTTTAKV